MGKIKGRAEQARRLVDMGVPVSVEERWSPDPDAIVEEYHISMPLIGMGRIVGRQALDASNRLIEFSLTAQIQDRDAKWSDVIRIDTAHEEVHVHYFSYTGTQIDKETLFPICNISDVDRGYRAAETLIIVNWEEHERRWRHGR